MLQCGPKYNVCPYVHTVTCHVTVTGFVIELFCHKQARIKPDRLQIIVDYFNTLKPSEGIKAEIRQMEMRISP